MADINIIRKKANRYFFTKLIFNLFLIIYGAVLTASILTNMQKKESLERFREVEQNMLSRAAEEYAGVSADYDSVTRLYHSSSKAALNNYRRIIENGTFPHLESTEERENYIRELILETGGSSLFCIDKNGTVLFSDGSLESGTDLHAAGIIEEENLEALITFSDEPVLSSQSEGDIFYYAAPVMYNGRECVLITSAYRDDLEAHTENLNSMSGILKAMDPGYNGFVFAVDKASGEVITGDEDNTELKTGIYQDLDLEALLTDGEGIQKIGGTSYYIVSKECSERLVMASAAKPEDISRKARYMLYWSINGFVLVMLMCLVYAVIVRNDFIRHETKTRKKVITRRNGNPLIFDISVFNKTVPLMLSGVLIIFMISYYSQTIAGIEQVCDESRLIIREIGGSYELNENSTEQLRGYYTGRYLADARTIARSFEENPSFLNEKSDSYYSWYDNMGTRQFVPDRYGNPLKTVSFSEELQNRCFDSNIEAIYVFDESGRTIATNTTDAYFTLAKEETDEQFCFRDVLSGSAEAAVKTIEEEDNLSSTAVAASFHYWTALDKDGNTVYLSRYDAQHPEQDEYGESLYTDISGHRSMIMISLYSGFFDSILSRTSITGILSGENAGGGIISMYEGSDEHTCLYSPVASRTGRTAAELGIPANAFSGEDYYSFERIDSVPHFSIYGYRSFANGNVISRSVPKSTMYGGRFRIAAWTSVISLILIIILIMTVTLTSKEEETLYMTMSETKDTGRLDSAIFNIILPSGRSTSTKKASARWNNSYVPWSERSAEQKLFFIMGAGALLMLVYTALSVAGFSRILGNDSVIGYILSGRWQRGPNIFAFSACAGVIVMTYLAVTLFRIPVRLLTSLFGARGETVAHLIVSVVRYGGIIGSLFYCLYLLGLDSIGILAGAGVFTLIIGLGAQSLITDIIAGIFIVFEGEFRVGDIVTIGGYRGTVEDIGLRTTKIMGFDGNVKIFNNSDISGVLNMTKKASYAVANIDIEYGQDIHEVEEILKAELPLLKAKNPALLGDPVFGGVSALNESSVTLIFFCQCAEKDVFSISRFMNRELLDIFYRHHISIPFPHVTVDGSVNNGQNQN